VQDDLTDDVVEDPAEGGGMFADGLPSSGRRAGA
jgi:hypothetical protein